MNPLVSVKNEIFSAKFNWPQSFVVTGFAAAGIYAYTVIQEDEPSEETKRLAMARAVVTGAVVLLGSRVFNLFVNED